MYRALAGMEKEAVHEFAGVVNRSRAAGGQGVVSDTPLVNRKMVLQCIEKKE